MGCDIFPSNRVIPTHQECYILGPMHMKFQLRSDAKMLCKYTNVLNVMS